MCNWLPLTSSARTLRQPARGGGHHRIVLQREPDATWLWRAWHSADAAAVWSGTAASATTARAAAEAAVAATGPNS